MVGFRLAVAGHLSNRPPGGAQLASGAESPLAGWLARLLQETWREAGADFTLLLLLGLLGATWVARRSRRFGRPVAGVRGGVVLVVLHLCLLPVVGALAAAGSSALPDVRLLARTFALLGGINVALILAFHGVLRWLRIETPGLLRDVIAATAYVFAALLLLSTRGVNVSGLIATSAVLTAIIGFSLQDTLGNIMAGLAIQLEKSLRPGDWIEVGGHSGRVVEIRWRQTAIETRAWETVIIPNSVLAKAQIVIQGRRLGEEPRLRRSIAFHVDYRFRPERVIEVCVAALTASPVPGVAASPRPNCLVLDLRGSFNHYDLRYWLEDLAADEVTDSGVRMRIFAALRRAGIELGVPMQTLYVAQREQQDEREQQARLARCRQALGGVELFRGLDGGELDALCRAALFTPFAPGEVLTRQNGGGSELFVLTEGRVSVRVSAGEAVKEVAVLAAGSFFGEGALITGEPRNATVVAIDYVECYRLGKEAVQRLLTGRPEIAAQLAEVLARRQAELESARDSLAQRSSSALAEDTQRILVKIRNFFGM
jgi:small-conductance mechanosensitive channel/CRP-like cAMP-binding protein